MNESDVADFLLAHPAFFERHAELLSRIKLSNPHGNRAVSLPERQMEILREKNRQFERRLGELVRYGHENDSNAIKFDRWSARLLAERDVARVPAAVCDGLCELFDVPKAALRLWQVADAHADHPAARFAGPDIERYTNSLGAPYCGANTQSIAAAWLDDASASLAPSVVAAPAATTAVAAGDIGTPLMPVGGPALSTAAATAPATESIALVPLRAPHADPASGTFGLLVMGSSDARRFREDMSTDFLIRIGTLASAALSRLLP